MHQLIAITHKIFSALDANPSLEVCGIFLDLSKAFDRVWYDGLLLNNRCQGVAFNGQSSVWKSVTAGVPQDSVLGPLFFLISIDYLPLGLTTDVKLSADDASFFSVVNHASVSTSNSCND